MLLATLAHAATITVTGNGNNSAVDGFVTLAEAIASINNSANLNSDVVAVGGYGSGDTIHFAIPGAGVHTISVDSALIVNKPVKIDGYSQAGSTSRNPALASAATSDSRVVRCSSHSSVTSPTRFAVASSSPSCPWRAPASLPTQRSQRIPVTWIVSPCIVRG